MCINSMGFPICYSFHISEYLIHSLLRSQMIGLIKNLELVHEEIILKVIRRDIVIRFKFPNFFLGRPFRFLSTGKPFFAQVALSGFQLPGCTDFLFYP